MTQQHDAPEGGDKAFEAAHAAFWAAVPFVPRETKFREAMRLALAAYEAARPSDRSGDAAGIVGEAIAVARAAQGPHTIAPTPPAPSGLVDAVRPAIWRCRASWWDESRPWDYLPERPGDIYGYNIIEPLYAATLSGQQGGAVPAGDLRLCLAALTRYGIASMTEGRVIERGDNTEAAAQRTLRAWDGVVDAIRARLAEQPAPAGTFQDRNASWMERVFAGDPTDLSERVNRFGEEALELQQALGQTAAEAHALVDYVHGRPVGEPGQEYGGTMTTLALLASVTGHDLMACGEIELARCSTPEIVAKIREKRSKRHGRGPLPGTYAPDFTPAPAGTGADGVEGLRPSCAWRSGCKHAVACSAERRCVGPALSAGGALLSQAGQPAPGFGQSRAALDAGSSEEGR